MAIKQTALFPLEYIASHVTVGNATAVIAYFPEAD
jgi:hypothetical protein